MRRGETADDRGGTHGGWKSQIFIIESRRNKLILQTDTHCHQRVYSVLIRKDRERERERERDRRQRCEERERIEGDTVFISPHHFLFLSLNRSRVGPRIH